MSRERAGAAVIVSGVAIFWAAQLLLASLAEDYSSRRDYVSSLASRGSSVALGGELALLALAAAHLAAAYLVRDRWSAWVLATSLLLATSASVAVVGFRANCPAGEAGCDVGDHGADKDWVATAHSTSAISYAFLMLIVMAVTASGLRGRHRWPQWLAAVSIPLALASAVCLAFTNAGTDAGAWERAWLAVNSLWLLALVAALGTNPAVDV